MTDVFSEATSDIESVLSDLGFTSATIDALGDAFTSFGTPLPAASRTPSAGSDLLICTAMAVIDHY